MLVFNERTMERVTAKRSFVISAGDLALDRVDSDGEPYESVSIQAGDEIWVLRELVTSGDSVFVYFPKCDFATSVHRNLINLGQ